MLGRLVLFFVFTTLISAGAGVYTARRLIRPLPISNFRRRMFSVALVGVFVLPWIGVAFNFVVERAVGPGSTDALLPVTWIAMLSFAVSTWLVTVAVLGDLLRGVRWALRRAKKQAPEAVDPVRRQLVQTAVTASAVGTSTLLLGVGVREALQGPEVITQEVTLAGLPQQFDGYTIAQISDLHVGLTIRRDYVEMAMKRASDVGADAIAITGDLVDGSVEELRRLAEPLKELRAPDGVFFSTGNHEYISGVDPWLDEVARYGMTPLVNAHRLITRDGAQIAIGGVIDHSAGRFGVDDVDDPERAFRGAPVGAKRILLAHQPKQVVKAARAGVDLQLSGHTHGGQFFPWNFGIHLVQRYVAGLYQHDQTQLYVNRGTGYWGPPIRLGPPSEITRLVLRSG